MSISLRFLFVSVWISLLLALFTASTVQAQSCASTCPQTHCIEQICQQCLENNHTCPPWLQGRWSGLHLRQDGTTQQAQPWEMEIKGHNVTMSGQGVSGLQGRTYCNRIERNSTGGGVNAYDMDLIYDQPTGYKGSASPSIIQLYTLGLAENTMQLQVMLPYRFVPYEAVECDTPRIPPSEFSAPIPLTYWVVRYQCTTPPIISVCPHWYDGKWAASEWTPKGGVGAHFVHSKQLLTVSGTVLQMTSTSSATATATDGAHVQYTSYAFKCVPSTLPSGDDRLEMKLDVDLSTTDSIPSHTARGVSLFSSFPGQFELTLAQPNWCQRPYDTNNAFIYPVSFTPPHVTSTFVCVEPIMQDPCTIFLLGKWRGESALDHIVGDMNSHTWNTTRIHMDSTSTSKNWLESEFNGRGWLELSNVSCAVSSSFPSMVVLDIVHSIDGAPNKMGTGTAEKVSGWITHALVRFGATYADIELVLGEPGKCNRPTSTDLTTPSGGFTSFRMTCALKPLNDVCPQWLYGHRNTPSSSNVLSGMVINVGGALIPFDIQMLIPGNQTILGTVTCGGLFDKTSNESSSVAIDIHIRSPTSLSGWVQRGWATYLSNVGAVQLFISSPGVCLRPKPPPGKSTQYQLHPNNHDHIRKSIYECSTPPLVGACPRWLDGSWNIIGAADRTSDHGMGNALPEWMDGSIEPVNLTIFGSKAYVGVANGAVVLHWITCGTDYDGTVSVDFQPDSQSFLAGRTLRVLTKFDDHTGNLKIALANHGWCSRPVSLYDIDPYHVNEYSCTTSLVGNTCPRWLDGHWDIFQKMSSSLVFEWNIKSNVSTIVVKANGEEAEDQLSLSSGIPDVNHKSQIVIYCGTTISSSLHVDMEIDLSYQSAATNLSIVERGWLRRTSVLPRSSAYMIRSPPNWCYRHAPASASVRLDTVNCSTGTLEGRCPGWLRGTWKFHDTQLLQVVPDVRKISPLPFQSRKWVVSNNVRHVAIQDLVGARGALLNCSNSSVSLDGKEYFYLDVSYVSDNTTLPMWNNRMDHYLVALDTSNSDTPTISIVEAPPGWCSRPPRDVHTIKGLDDVFKASSAVQVESPRNLFLFSVLPVWETLHIGVTEASSTLKFVWDVTTDDRNSPVHQYLLVWDVEPQMAVCDVGYAGGVFGACCNSDDDCSSSVCDTVNRVCTYICQEDSECPAVAQHKGQTSLCKDASPSGSIHDDPLPVRRWCDASQLTPFGTKFCGVFCLELNSVDANGIHENVSSSRACEDATRERCLLHRFQERACHSADVRQALGLSGHQTYHRLNKNATVRQFVVGVQYYSKMYAGNEIGYGWPTMSLPSYEIPRAAPPPPSFLAVTQVEAATLNASGMTLEDAKTSIKVTFSQPAFDNGAPIATHFVEWHVHPSFVDVASHFPGTASVGGPTCLVDTAINAPTFPLLYGQNVCGEHCLMEHNQTKSGCSDYPSCPFLDNNESIKLCNELGVLNTVSNTMMAPFEDSVGNVTRQQEQQEQQCNLKFQELDHLWHSSHCTTLQTDVDTASLLPHQAFKTSVPLCSINTCLGDVWAKLQMLSTNHCQNNGQSNQTYLTRLQKYVDVRCAVDSNGTSCGALIPRLKQNIDNKTLTCKMLRTFIPCVAPIAKFWIEVESTSNVSINAHYGLTTGKLHNQTTTRHRISRATYGRSLETLHVFCPPVPRDVCPPHNVSDGCKNVREHCLCNSPLDPGCSHPHVVRRLQTAQVDYRMSIAASRTQSQYSIVVSNVLPRTPYYVRVGALNEIGVSMYRTTPKPVAALVIAEKPIDVFIALLSNITNQSTRAALSTSVFIRFRTAAIDWNWVTYYRIDVSRDATFNSSTILREIRVDQPELNPFESRVVNMTVDQLTPGVRYYFQVAAYITTFGRPQVATPISIVPPLQVPDPPRNFTAYPINGSILAVNWSVPFFDGGRPLLAHQLEWSQHQNFSCTTADKQHGHSCGDKVIELPMAMNENSTLIVDVVGFDVSLTTRIEPVSMGQFYHIRISSCNDLGCGILANHPPVKPMQPPSVPLQVHVGVHNHSALKIKFTAPESTGGDSVDYYVVHWEIPSQDLSAQTIVWPTEELFQNITSPVLPPWSGCNCTSTLPYPSSKGKCCCRNKDCAGNMVCHSELHSCTYACSSGNSFSNNNNNSNKTLNTTCSSFVLATQSTQSAQSNNSNVTDTLRKMSLSMQCNTFPTALNDDNEEYCEVLCPFNQNHSSSPCVFRAHSLALDQSACTLSDFQGGWVLSSTRGGIHDKPATLCATYIRRYCSVIDKNDPACSLLAVQHVLNQIPSCPQRVPAPIKEGFFASVVVRALGTNSNVNSSHHGYGAPHQVGVSACNAAGCSDVAVFETLVTPAAHLLFSETHQCTAEGRSDDKYYISLNSKPTSRVEVRIQGDLGQLQETNMRVHFSPLDWNQKKEVIVAAVDDYFDEGKSTFLTMAHSIVTADDIIAKTIRYIPSEVVNVTIFDNDYAGVSVSHSSLILSEGFIGKEVFYQAMTRPFNEVRLVLEPTQSTFVSVQDVVFSPNITDWDTKHRVVFTAIDDQVDEIDLEVEYVQWTSLTEDQIYNNTSVPVLSTMVVDDDFASLVLEYSSLQLNEGEDAATYRVTITSQPTSKIAIIISVGPARSCAFNGTSLALDNGCRHLKEISTDVWVTSNGKVAVDDAVIFFSPNTWNVSQFFMVTAKEDSMDMGDTFNMTLQHTSISEDANYNRRTDVMVPLEIQITDNDEAILTMSRWDVVVTEDGLYEDEYTILFETMPTSISCITASLEGFDQVSVEPSEMCFGESNWSLPQAFHLSATQPLPGTRSNVGALVGWITHTLTTKAVEYSDKTLDDVEITVVEKKSDLDLTAAPIYKSVAFSDVAHEIIVQFETAAYVLNFGKATATSCVSYFIERVILKMGTAPTCYWSDRFTLHAVLGSGWTIAPEQKVTLRSGAVRTTASSIITSGGYKLLQERKPAPVLRGISFAESGGAILIRFDSSIGCWEGLSDDASTTSCSKVMQDAEHLLGKNAKCTWVEQCLLQVVLGFGATLRATKDVSACGSCECNSCVPRAAYKQAGSFDAFCKSPAHQCADPQCYCKDTSTKNLCPTGFSLKLLPGAIKAIRFGLLSSEGCMHVQYPNVIFVPKSVITAPRNFPVCSPLVVSGTDSETSGGGRDQFFWSVIAFDNDGGGLSQVTNDVLAIVTQANVGNADLLEFPANVFEFGTRYRFSLGISNFLTTSAQSTTFSNGTGGTGNNHNNQYSELEAQQIDYLDITASYIPLPQLTIVGSSKITVKSRDRVILRAKAYPAVCAKDQSLVYSWYQVQGDLDWEAVKQHQRGNFDLTLPVLVIPPNMLTKGRDYIFRVSAYARSTPTLTNYENVLLSVTSGVTVAGLDSYHRTCGVDDPLSINAIDHSHHQDDVSAVLNFDWSCVYIAGGDNRPCNAMKYSSGESSGMLTLPRNSFAAGDQILFTVNVHLSGDRSDVDSANMTVTILPGLTPVVQIKQGSHLVINPEDKLSLSGTVQWPPSESVGAFFWTETSGSLDLLQETQKVYYSAQNRLHLVVRPNLLVPGRHYTFVLTAVGKKTNGSATVSVVINRPPRGGFFQVTPTVGKGLATEFSFTLGSWADDENNYPLSYIFYASHVENSNELENIPLFPLSVDKIENSRQIFRLPAGKKENMYRVYPTAHVCDSLGACAICNTKNDGSTVVLDVKPLSTVDTLDLVETVIDKKYPSVEDTVVIGIAVNMLFPKECLALSNSESSAPCQSVIDEHRPRVEDMLSLLVASEAITLPSTIALEQQSLALAEISAFADKTPSSFVDKLIEHGNRIVESAFASGFSLSSSSVVGLHAMFESLVDAATCNMSHINQSWSVGQQVSHGIERAVSNALLNHVVGEDPLVVSGTKLSIYGKIESLSKMPWVPLALLNVNVGTMGFAMPSSIQGIDADTTSLQFVAVAQSEVNPGSQTVKRIITELNLYDHKANKIALGNLTQPIGLSLPMLDTVSDEMKCFFWNSGTSKWSQNGLFVQELNRNNNTDVLTVGCATTHLTSFLLETTEFFPETHATYKGYNNMNNTAPFHEQLIFIFDTSNIPVSGIMFGMSIFYVLLLVAIHTYEKQSLNNEFAKSSMERFLNTGSTVWSPSEVVDKRTTTNLLKSYLATVAHQHPLFGFLRPSSQLGMPRLCYVLILWNTTSTMFCVSSALIGGSNLNETENLPLGWFFALCGLTMVFALQKIVSCLLNWKSKQMVDRSRCSLCCCCCCCCCRRSNTNFAIVQSRKRIQLSKTPERLWVDFERLRTRCITYVDYRKAVVANDGNATGVRAANIILMNNGFTSNMASYERYVVRTAQQQGYPYPRSVYNSVLVLQASWRAYVVKTNLTAFLTKKTSSTKRQKYVFRGQEEQDNRNMSIVDTKHSKKKKTGKNNNPNSNHNRKGYQKGHHKGPNKRNSTKKDKGRGKRTNTSSKTNSNSNARHTSLTKYNGLYVRLRQIALILQTSVSASGGILILVGVSELFGSLHRQYAQATVGLGFFVVAIMGLGSFTLKYCNGVHLGLYVVTNAISCLVTLVLFFTVSSAGSTDLTTLNVVRSEWEGLYASAATMTTSEQQLLQWQNTYSCCGVQDVEDQNTVMAVQPCSLNRSNGCEVHLAQQVKNNLTMVQFALVCSALLQLLSFMVCLVLSVHFDFRGFDGKQVIEAMKKDSAQMIQAFSRGKNPSDLATFQLFTGLTTPTTYKAANIIQNSARVYLARRRCYRKQEYDRIVGLQTQTMQAVLNGTILSALIVSATVLDVLAVALALKFDDIRTTRWRQSMELSCAILFGVLIPCCSVVTLVSDSRWKAWLRVRCWVWHETT